MLDVSIGGAFLAGLISFVSPCVLPIVPPYLAYIAGLSFSQLTDDGITVDTQRRLFMSAVFFVLGFTTIFVMLGAAASFLGHSIAQHFDTLSVIAGLIIIIMGLHFLGVLKIGFLYREARLDVEKKPAGMIGAYVMGLAFAFGWTPCVGPVLATILFVAGAEGSAARGAMLLSVYSLGIGVPFLLASLFVGSFLKAANKFKRHMALIEKLMGALLIVTGIMFMTGSMSYIAQWMIDTFPGFATIG